ncbi:MAG: hypothetical protein ABIH67_01455 [Candidatus Uhrbacteria bacterium]
MSNTPNYDAKVKTILDALKPGERVCALTGEKWMMDEEEISWYKKFNVPPHPWSPLTRMKQLASFYTIYQFWYQKHPETGKDIVTGVHPGSGWKVLPDKEWFDRDFADNNFEPNLSLPVFEQMAKFKEMIPMPATKVVEVPENSLSLASLGETNDFFTLAVRGQNNCYAIDALDLESSLDIVVGSSISNSYQVTQSHRIHNSKFIYYCFDCINSLFLFDCRNCENCFGATNKRYKKYLWFNEQLTQDEYEKRIAEVDLSCRSKMKEWKDKFDQFMQEQGIWPENFNEHCTNVVGEFTRNAIDCKYIFGGTDGPYRDMYQILYAYGNCNDCAWSAAPVSSNNTYLINTSVSSAQVKFCMNVKECQDCEYCFYSYNCESCFGCVGLRNKKYHIFNKEYNEDDYWQMIDQIKCHMLENGEYGNFFPTHFSTAYFPYAGGWAYYNCDEEEGKRLGALQYELEAFGATGPTPDPDFVVESSHVPNCLVDLDAERWSKKHLFDSQFGRRFRLLTQEIDFYKKHKLAPPNRHFIFRIRKLLKEQNSAVFSKTVCGSCNKSVTLTINFARPHRKIYCRECYLEYLEKYG